MAFRISGGPFLLMASIGDRTASEVLIENADPDWVTCQMDLFRV